MNQIVGIAMMGFALALAVHYRPASQESRKLCAVCFVMGLVALIAGSGGWLFQIWQLFLACLVAFCAGAELYREKKHLRRRRSQLKACHRASYAAVGSRRAAGAEEALESAWPA